MSGGNVYVTVGGGENPSEFVDEADNDLSNMTVSILQYSVTRLTCIH